MVWGCAPVFTFGGLDFEAGKGCRMSKGQIMKGVFQAFYLEEVTFLHWALVFLIERVGDLVWHIAKALSFLRPFSVWLDRDMASLKLP